VLNGIHAGRVARSDHGAMPASRQGQGAALAFNVSAKRCFPLSQGVKNRLRKQSESLNFDLYVAFQAFKGKGTGV
jgi:hypothetical protein